MENHPSAQGLHPLRLANGPNGHGPYVTEAHYAAVELLKYAMLLQRRWRLIAGVTLGVTLAVAIDAKFVMKKVWRAETLVTPVSPSENAQNEAGSSMMDSLNGAGGLAAIFGFASQNDNAVIAQRYMAIMTSYAFTMSLADRYHLDRLIVAESGWHSKPTTRWALYRRVRERFGCQYDYKSGNLSLYFIDPDPGQAERVLRFYLDNLRDKLRNEGVQSASEAVLSLREEIRKTSDALLQNQLYDLMARQVQREKLAQIQADFAFKVIEPPVVPDNYYGYGLRVWIPLAASLTLFALCAFFVIKEWISSARAHLASEMGMYVARGYEDADDAAMLGEEPRPVR